jgi:hypothetical protein
VSVTRQEFNTIYSENTEIQYSYRNSHRIGDQKLVVVKGHPDQPRRAENAQERTFSFDVPTLCGSCLLMHEVAQTGAVLHGLSSKPAALRHSEQYSAARRVWSGRPFRQTLHLPL